MQSTSAASVDTTGSKTFGLLSDAGIRRHIDLGNIVIAPTFCEQQLGTNTYDVRLGEFYYRESSRHDIYNTRSEDSVNTMWSGPFNAERAGDWMEANRTQLDNIDPEERIIWIDPGESLLCHTHEFIGTRRKVTTIMKARSSVGRSCLQVCSDAGVGDIGYFNRWTMEITNRSLRHRIPLVVGQRVAQIEFHETEGAERCYTSKGKYQTSDVLATVVKNWKPSMMLPRMHSDWELSLPVDKRPGSLVPLTSPSPSMGVYSCEDAAIKQST